MLHTIYFFSFTRTTPLRGGDKKRKEKRKNIILIYTLVPCLHLALLILWEVRLGRGPTWGPDKVRTIGVVLRESTFGTVLHSYWVQEIKCTLHNYTYWKPNKVNNPLKPTPYGGHYVPKGKCPNRVIYNQSAASPAPFGGRRWKDQTTLYHDLSDIDEGGFKWLRSHSFRQHATYFVCLHLTGEIG